MSAPYHKIYGPYKRRVDGPDKGNLIIGEWSKPEFKLLRNLTWTWTEKLDGTNVRVHWDGHSVSFAGRTDRAQIPTFLSGVLETAFTEEIFEQEFGEQEVTLYGEGVGPKIQKGGKYAADHVFVLFDVRVGRFWLRRFDVFEAARNMGINAVPVVHECGVEEAIDMVSSGLRSPWGIEYGDGEFEAEGVVGVPEGGFLARSGERIIMKIKSRDFRS